MDPFAHTTTDLPPRTPWGRAAMILAFIGLLVGGDRLLALGLEALQARSGFRFSRVYAGGQVQHDVVVLGDSRGVNGFFAPGLSEATGRSVLNLSYNGMSTAVAEVVFLDYLDRHPAPKTLIIEPTNVLAAPGLAATLSSYAGRSPRLRALIEAQDPTAATAGEITHLYRFNTELFLRALYYLGRSDQGWINDYRIGEAQLAALREAPVVDALPELREANLAALGRLVAAARAAGCEVKLVVGPYLPLYRRTLGWWPAFLARLTEAAGAPVVDLSLAVDDPTAFADRLHLNRRGVAPLLAALRAQHVLR